MVKMQYRGNYRPGRFSVPADDRAGILRQPRESPGTPFMTHRRISANSLSVVLAWLSAALWAGQTLSRGQAAEPPAGEPAPALKESSKKLEVQTVKDLAYRELYE